MIENYQYPLAGMEEEEICEYFTDLLSPYSSFFDHLQSALYLHNIPLFCFIFIFVLGFFHLLKVIVSSKFPTVFFLASIIPVVQLFCLLGGNSLFKTILRDMPVLPIDDPKHIRPVKSIVRHLWKPLSSLWMLGFFVYRTLLCPNVVDTITLLILITLVGLLFCIFDFILIFQVIAIFFLIVPSILTKERVYRSLMLHIGHPYLAPSKDKDE